jgi:flagellar protein FliT
MTAATREAEVGRLIGSYLSIERASRDMLAAAVVDDWDRVAGIQQRCDELIDQVRGLAVRVALPAAERRAKMRIIRQIVRNEAQIRRLAQPWTARHERMLQPRGDARPYRPEAR